MDGTDTMGHRSFPIKDVHPVQPQGRAKIALIKDFLEFGVDVVITDIDTAWLRNPLPFFSRYPHADILTSSGALGCEGAWEWGRGERAM
eukprot:22932-Chlamydomonas_euryale.AAC.2